MRKMLVMLTLLLFTSGVLLAQKTVSGKVADEKGDPVANASVLVKGTTVGTTTNDQGSFTITLPEGKHVIVISSVNFAEKQVTIGNETNVTINLVSNSNQEEEVVVTGYGSGRRVGTIVSNVATVNAKMIQNRPNANAFDALQGKVAGLQVFTSNGEPSQSSSVRLHGVGSLSAGSTPLIVLDGIPMDLGTMISLNPEDFESVSVLKDASATSIYGARAANGVIYLVSKKGDANKPAQFSVQTIYGQSSLARPEYFEGLMNRNELLGFLGETNLFTQSQITAINTQYPNTDTRWYKQYYQNNQPTFQTTINFSGGSGKTTYYVSGGYYKEEGLMYRSAYERFTGRANLTTKLNNWMNFRLNLSGGYDERETNGLGSNNLNGGLSVLHQPWFSPVDANGKRYDLIPGLGLLHPEYIAEKQPGTANNLQFNPSAAIEIIPFKNLIFKTQVGMDFYDYTTQSRRLASHISFPNAGTAARGFQRGNTRTVTNTLEYKFKVATDHNITALVGQEWVDFKGTTLNGSAIAFADDRLMELGVGTTPAVSSSLNEYAFASYFGRFEYNFKNKYFLDLTGRQDQSSRFGIDNRTARFWSIGGMWKVSSEKFMDNITWIKNLNLRASTGTSGNSSIGNYQNLALVGTTSPYDGVTGRGISSAGNNLLQWESQQKTTIGADFTLFNLFNLDVSYYSRSTSNMLVEVPYPYTSGFANITTNVGKLKNTGIDVTLNADVVNTKDWTVSPYVNFSYNWNKVDELFQGRNYWIQSGTGVAWVVGEAINFLYPIFAGIDPQTGNATWYQPANGVTGTSKDPSKTTTAFATSLQQNTGINRFAPFNGGFGLRANYKGFNLDVDFAFSSGKYMINNDRYFIENPTQFTGYNQAKTVMNYWKQPGDVTEFPRIGSGLFTQFDSRLIENASFMRMKNITLGYSIPKNILSAAKIFSEVRFFVTGRNLLTFTKYTGPDPEVDSNLGLGTYPNTKQVSFGLNLRF